MPPPRRSRRLPVEGTRPGVASTRPNACRVLGWRAGLGANPGRSAQRRWSARACGRPVGAKPRNADRYGDRGRTRPLAQSDELRRLVDERESMRGEQTEAAVLERVIMRRRVPFRRGRPGAACHLVIVVMGRGCRPERGRPVRMVEQRQGSRGRLLERVRGRQKQARHRRTECQSCDRDESQPGPRAKVASCRTHRLTVIEAWRAPAVRNCAGAVRPLVAGSASPPRSPKAALGGEALDREGQFTPIRIHTHGHKRTVTTGCFGTRLQRERRAAPL